MKVKKFWKLQAKAGAEKEGEMLVYGPIDSDTWWGDEVTPKEFKNELDSLGDIATLHIYINSFGGDVFAGQAIYSILKRHNANKVVYVDGLAASIASIIAMAGDTVIMPKNAMMMVHNPWTFAFGNAGDFRKLADDLEKIGESLVAVYVDKTGLERETIEGYLDGETWFTAEEAVELGFADVLEEEKKVAACLRIAATLQESRIIVNDVEFELSRFKKLPINKFTIEQPENDIELPDPPAPPDPPEESPPDKRVFDIKRRVQVREKSHRRIKP